MKALSFILQRFYWNIGGSCIINIFVMSNFYILVLADKITLHKELEFLSKIQDIPIRVSVLLFLASMVIVGIFLEGINETGCQYYVDNYRGKESKERNPMVKLLHFIFVKATTLEACKRIYEAEKETSTKDSIHAYMFAPDITNYSEATVAMQVRARKVAEKEKDVYIFRDLSFMTQLMRTALLIISLLSLIAMILIVIFCGTNFLFWWYLTSCGIATIFFILTNPITLYFGKRYIRDVGRSYKAFFE